MRAHGVRLGGLALAIGLLTGCADRAAYQQGYGYGAPYGYTGAYATNYYDDGVSWDDGIYGYGLGGGYWGGYRGHYGHVWHGGGGFATRGFGGHGFGGSHGFGGGGFHGGGGGHGGGGHR